MELYTLIPTLFHPWSWHWFYIYWAWPGSKAGSRVVIQLHCSGQSWSKSSCSGTTHCIARHMSPPSHAARSLAFGDVPFVSIDALFFIMNTRLYSEHNFNLIEVLYSCWKIFFRRLWGFCAAMRSLPKPHTLPSSFKHRSHHTKTRGLLWQTTRSLCGGLGGAWLSTP